MTGLLVALAIAVGMVIPVQAGINAELRRHAGHPLLAAVVNFAVGLVALLVVTLVLRVPWTSQGDHRWTAAPTWAWLGGLCGASLVFVSVIAAPRLGAALLIACLLAGQLAMSLALDHFGWVGFAERPITAQRLAGAALLAIGVWLIHRG